MKSRILMATAAVAIVLSLVKVSGAPITEQLEKIVTLSPAPYADGGLFLVKEFEGYSQRAYRDGKNRFSIGYGTRAKSKLETISLVEAEIRTLEHLRKYVFPTVDLLGITCPYQYAATVSIVYNIGSDRFQRSKTRLAILSRNEEAIRKEWSEWRLASGRVNKGLVRRRAQELEIFFYKK